MREQIPFQPLSPREEQVLDLVRLGRGNREIANELGLSTETVKTEVKSLHRKLGVNNRYEAAFWPERPPAWALPGIAPVFFWFRGKHSILELATRPLGWLVSGAVVAGGVALAVLFWAQFEGGSTPSDALQMAMANPSVLLAQAEQSARAAQSYRMTEDQFAGGLGGSGTPGFMLVEYEAPGNYHGLTKTVLSSNFSSCDSQAIPIDASGTPIYPQEPTVETCSVDETEEITSILEMVVHDRKMFVRQCQPDETQCEPWQTGEGEPQGLVMGADPHATPDWPLFMLTKLSEPVVVGEDVVDGETAVHIRGKVSIWRMFLENLQRHLGDTGTPYGSSCEGDVCRDISFDEALRTDEAVLESDKNPMYADIWISSSETLPLRIHVSAFPTDLESDAVGFRVNYGSFNRVNVEAPDLD